MNISQEIKIPGIEIPSLLLPKPEYLQKWPVIACDQFTQDRDYWERAKTITDGAPSTLNLIFPEVFLADDDAEKRITAIHSAMKTYLQDGIFAQPLNGFIYIERDTPYQKKRRGLVAAIDLEQYDWHPDARPLIRSTEGTVPERLPPRMDIRRGAPLELPHVLLLIDDDEDSLLPGLGERVKNSDPYYSTQLMMDSGTVTGWFVNTSADDNLTFIYEKLDKLYKRSFNRYGDNVSTENKPFLFAVGDGNHSLAAAKGIWEEVKKELKSKGLKSNGLKSDSDYLSHPCRYALVEIENIYDPAIQFEPIHRLVFDIGYDDIIALLSKLPDFKSSSVSSIEELSRLCSEAQQASNRFGVISQGRYALIETSFAGISTACLQPLLDEFATHSVRANPQLIDYIHDEKELLRLVPDTEQRAAILLPPVQKSGLFQTVARSGPLPRKSFSMGHSCEKRFYLECRELI